VLTREGLLATVLRVLVSDHKGPLHRMRDGELVKANHRLAGAGGAWLSAAEWFPETEHFEGKVYNLEVEAETHEGHSYLLDCGLFAHNVKL